MNRRHFLKTTAGAAASLYFVPLLETPEEAAGFARIPGVELVDGVRVLELGFGDPRPWTRADIDALAAGAAPASVWERESLPFGMRLSIEPRLVELWRYEDVRESIGDNVAELTDAAWFRGVEVHTETTHRGGMYIYSKVSKRLRETMLEKGGAIVRDDMKRSALHVMEEEAGIGTRDKWLAGVANTSVDEWMFNKRRAQRLGIL